MVTFGLVEVKSDLATLDHFYPKTLEANNATPMGGVGSDEYQEVTEAVRIVRAKCRFGGARPYFICPGVVNDCACGRRVVKLHGVGRYFLCRHCYRLAHASQSEGALDRALRRANMIRQNLGGTPGLATQFPPKPKGMWWQTYERQHERVYRAEMQAEKALIVQAERLLARCDRSSRKGSFRR